MADPSGVVATAPADSASDRGTALTFRKAWEARRRIALSEEVRLSLRIVVLLDQLGPPRRGELGPSENTQQGISSSLSVTQGAVSKVLSRLAAADIVRRDRLHVPGRLRRLRVYSLTQTGAILARDAVTRFAGRQP